MEELVAEMDATVSSLQRHYDIYHRLTDTSFGGIAMAQQWADLWMWEAILNDNPQIKAIFEIGTWQGGFSFWLWSQAQARDLHFETYDATIPDRSIPGFERHDVFADSELLGERFRTWEPCVVFCDGGNKPRELNTFAAELRSQGSLLLVHDWGTEILLEDVPDHLEMIYRTFCLDLSAITRVFQLKGEQDEG